VTWAITDENKPVKDGRSAEPGPLRIYNYADYLDPVNVQLGRGGDREAVLRRG
jgi:hypothetical protein